MNWEEIIDPVDPFTEKFFFFFQKVWFFFLKDIFIYLKGTVIQRDRDLSTDPKWLQWPSLGSFKTRSLFQASYQSAGVQAVGPPSTAFPGTVTWSWNRSGAARAWTDAHLGFYAHGFTCHAKNIANHCEAWPGGVKDVGKISLARTVNLIWLPEIPF